MLSLGLIGGDGHELIGSKSNFTVYLTETRGAVGLDGNFEVRFRECGSRMQKANISTAGHGSVTPTAPVHVGHPYVHARVATEGEFTRNRRCTARNNGAHYSTQEGHPYTMHWLFECVCISVLYC